MSRKEPRPVAHRPLAMVPAWTLAILLLSGCDREAQEPSLPVETEAPAPAAATGILPAPSPSLSRADLISAAREAASDYATRGEASGPDPLVGRNFAVRIPFGCGGPAPASPDDGEAQGAAQWSRGADGKTIELKLMPADWTASDLIAQDEAAPAWEAVEGFWVPHPWIEPEACPAIRSDPPGTGQPAAADQTLGLAAVFETGGSRIGRRDGRAYVSTMRAQGDAGPTPPNDGFRLVLEGRLVSFPQGRAIRCHAPGPDQRPVCVAATKLDRVAFETPQGEVLSEWRPG